MNCTRCKEDVYPTTWDLYLREDKQLIEINLCRRCAKEVLLCLRLDKTNIYDLPKYSTPPR